MHTKSINLYVILTVLLAVVTIFALIAFLGNSGPTEKDPLYYCARAGDLSHPDSAIMGRYLLVYIISLMHLIFRYLPTAGIVTSVLLWAVNVALWSYIAFRIDRTGPTVFATCVLLVFNPFFLEFAVNVLSDPLGIFLVGAAVSLVALPEHPSRGYFFLAGFLLGLGMRAREVLAVAGAVTLFSLALDRVVRRKDSPRKIAWAAFGSLSGWLSVMLLDAALLHNSLFSVSPGTYQSQAALYRGSVGGLPDLTFPECMVARNVLPFTMVLILGAFARIGHSALQKALLFLSFSVFAIESVLMSRYSIGFIEFRYLFVALIPLTPLAASFLWERVRASLPEWDRGLKWSILGFISVACLVLIGLRSRQVMFYTLPILLFPAFYCLLRLPVTHHGNLVAIVILVTAYLGQGAGIGFIHMRDYGDFSSFWVRVTAYLQKHPNHVLEVDPRIPEQDYLHRRLDGVMTVYVDHAFMIGGKDGKAQQSTLYVCPTDSLGEKTPADNRRGMTVLKSRFWDLVEKRQATTSSLQRLVPLTKTDLEKQAAAGSLVR